MQIFKELFHDGLSDELAETLFKSTVECLEVGISRFCNRVCDYCPNSTYDRRSSKDLMSDRLFYNIIYHLQKIQYSGQLQFHRYNEPLADLPYLIGRIRDAKKFVPACHIEIVTNGDYLNKDVAYQLFDAGVDTISATCHRHPGSDDFSDLKKQLDQRLKKLDFPYIYSVKNDVSLVAIIEIGQCKKITYKCLNFSARNQDGCFIIASDRAKSLNLQETFVRHQPCLLPFKRFFIEWDGSVQPCCNIHIDVPEHKEFSIGKITPDSNIFQAWSCKNMTEWRNELFSNKVKKHPCTTCITGIENYDARTIEIIREQMGLND